VIPNVTCGSGFCSDANFATNPDSSHPSSCESYVLYSSIAYRATLPNNANHHQQNTQYPHANPPLKDTRQAIAELTMSPRAATPQQLQQQTDADLTNWFLNAKRSLSSITLCSRAHQLVDNARQALQEASIISSRCVFLRKSLQDQLKIANQVNRMVHVTKDAARAEFEVCFEGWGGVG
jgi:hypothetical protein